MYIVDSKRSEAKEEIFRKCGCGAGCIKCSYKIEFIDKMADSNIPAAYWFKKMADFKGAINIKKTTIDYISDIKTNFKLGKSVCYTGNLGTGKTYSSCAILKAALIGGLSAYYTTLIDLGFYMTDFEFKKEFYLTISRADFLCIDEVDSRHFSHTEQSERFFGSSFERILRQRQQNNLPTIMATNNASLEEAFTGQFKKVVESLYMPSTIIVSAIGKDYRLKGDK